MSSIREHLVIPGENLATIAAKYYGDWRQWRTIYDTNTEILDDPNSVYPGQVLAIPFTLHALPFRAL